MFFRTGVHCPSSPPKFLSILKDLIFPKHCFSCRSYGWYLCPNCIGKLKTKTYLTCPVCHQKSIDGKTHTDCLQKHELNGLVSFYPYKSLVKIIIKKLKYDFYYDMEDELDQIISLALKKRNLKTFFVFLQKNPYIIPVPLYISRQNWRGFNQSVIIARSLSKSLKLKIMLNLLLRNKDTAFQAELSKKQRISNIKGAFVINKNINYKKLSLNSVLLVDDVWTSGATMRECGRVLKKAGVKEVWGLSLAA